MAASAFLFIHVSSRRNARIKSAYSHFITDQINIINFPTRAAFPCLLVRQGLLATPACPAPPLPSLLLQLESPSWSLPSSTPLQSVLHRPLPSLPPQPASLPSSMLLPPPVLHRPLPSAFTTASASFLPSAPASAPLASSALSTSQLMECCWSGGDIRLFSLIFASPSFSCLLCRMRVC